MFNRKAAQDIGKSIGMTEAEVMRYAQAPAQKSWVRRALNTLFGLGRREDPISGPSEREAERFFEKIAEIERQEQQQRERRSGPPPVIVSPRPAPSPSAPPPSRSDPGPPQPDLPQDVLRRHLPPRGGQPPYGQEILTPHSSNVFSFSYDPDSDILYVTYKAPELKSSHITTGKRKLGGRLSRSQLVGRSGAISGRSNSRGAQYAYWGARSNRHNKPMQRLYESMRAAVSKGKFVWDHLRVRGTVYGHQVNYALVQGAVITGGGGGVSGVYIPRKATRLGFKTRSVADLGRGARGFQTSTLPGQVGFSTRRRP